MPPDTSFDEYSSEDDESFWTPDVMKEIDDQLALYNNRV
jgi:hypothetical protein